MERKGINSSGRLGSFYDGCRDRVIEQPKMIIAGQELQLTESAQCKLIVGNTDTSQNLLQSINIDNELRLSLLLRLTNRTGIGAVLNHSRYVDQCTRILYYSWICQTEEFDKKKLSMKQIIGVHSPQISATHVITSVRFGIDLIVVLQLPSNIEIINKIDLVLEKIRDVLLKDNTTLKLTLDENNLLGEILHTKVYSNIPMLTNVTKVSDIFCQINMIKKKSYPCHPVTYNLEPITSLYCVKTTKQVIFKPLSRDLINNVEQYILRLRNSLKYLETSLNEDVPKLLCGYLHLQLDEAHMQWSNVKTKFQKETQRLSKLVIDARSSKKNAAEKIHQALQDNEAIALQVSIKDLTQYVIALETKGQLITNLRQEHFDYWNIEERNLNKSNDLRIIEQVIINDDPRNRALCSSDTLNINNDSKLTNLRRILVKKYEENSTLRLIYIDFSYSSFRLQDLIILPSDEIDHTESHSKKRPASPINIPQSSPINIPQSSPNNIPQSSPNNIPQSSPNNIPQSSPINVPQSSPVLCPSPSPTLPTDEIVNILLMGETGVGKSTFINAFANYLTFNSLEQAQSNEPVVVIPVSFIMAIGDDFEERTIEFGELDDLNNENFNNAGHSVTQHCKSYIFDFHHINGKKLRIIDTPGFGDTRGLNQDDRNIEHILQYINNLTHLNAICFLLKPNSSRLNIAFRTCLTQLFSFLSPDAHKNVIFCFSNSRSTFYTPGDTAPLLKTMLKSLSIDNISFEKDNTFCFDSESFRYLVALQNGILFTDEDKREYDKSWTISVKESNRLINHIEKKLSVYDMKNEWQSNKHAQFEIIYMIRPILETMRNILRNIILYKKNLLNELIELRSKGVHRTAAHCHMCKPDPQQVGQFWIIPDLQHELQNNCPVCSCTLDQHIPMDYRLEYKLSNNPTKYDKNQMIAMFNVLRQVCSKFAYFLMHSGYSIKDDPFIIGLNKMIIEEEYICENKKLAHLNMQLFEELTKLKSFHEEQMNNIKRNQEHLELPDIYNMIKSIGEHPLVHKQMIAVKQTQKIMMDDYEYEIQTI